MKKQTIKEFNQSVISLVENIGLLVIGIATMFAMGTAIRHATHYLNAQRTSKKLLMVITDGEPADIDVRDPQYLRYDAKKSVEDAARNGISTFCMTLDPRADQYVSRIFGAKNYMIVDQIARLPENFRFYMRA